jgi:SAM-dependent methyltransferase
VDARTAWTVASYDLIVEEYERRNANPSTDFTWFRDFFAESLPPGSLVADLGCGPGRDLAALRRVGLRVVGVDLSSGMVAKAYSDNLAVARGDLRRLPLRPHVFDGLWSSASLLHVVEAETAATLQAWRDLLRPGGLLGLSTSIGKPTSQPHENSNDGSSTSHREGWEDGWELPAATGDGTPKHIDTHRWFVHRDREALLGQIAGAGFEVLTVTEKSSHREWIQVLARRNLIDQ